ncbi:unnamed protein product [Microthlaspi erraticum]|uniref:F-box domain-containing protein n=1 Tax=Microthlaspi erraticum TaxID=1685480 RepID=A0A6D2K5R9_9BRAS|nr:unnamed protein product [Microthlaspi erraticum]
MMITNLPTDLMEDILSRVPSKATREVRLTCTEWNTIWNSQIFAKMHFDKAFDPAKEDGSESRMIVMMEKNLYLLSVFVNVNIYGVNNFSAEQKGKLTCLDEQVKISDVYHCDGLLLCIMEDDDTQVVVWNPYLGQTRWIQLRSSHVLPRAETWHNKFHYGIGYDKNGSCRNYKILRFIDAFLFEDDGYEFFWYEIYDFKSGLWTTLDVTDPHWRIQYGNGVSVKGNTYWCATDRISPPTDRPRLDHIICFDYTRMRFGPLLPLPYEHGYYSVTLSCVGEEKLAAYCNQYDSDPYHFQIWITTMIEAEKVSWSCLLAFYPESLPNDVRFSSFGGFYIDQVKKVAMFSGRRSNHHAVCIINEEGEYAGEVALEETDQRYWRKSLCSYVPSVVQIKQPKGGQRGKKQSDIEKLRYDEMMSRLSFLESKCKKLQLDLAKRKASTCKKISYPTSVVPEQARSTSFLSTNSFASLASSDDED